jgi:hypothetical protein
MRVESSSQGDDCIEVGHDKSKKTSCFKGRLGQKCSVESVTVLVSRKIVHLTNPLVHQSPFVQLHTGVITRYYISFLHQGVITPALALQAR